MPLPMWLAQINKRVFNKLEIKRGRRPVLSHTGRVSGRTHRVPLDAHPVDGGFIFFMMYGSGSDWVQNVLAAGTASLDIGDQHFELDAPRVLTEEEAWRLLPASVKSPPKRLNVTEYLLMGVLSKVEAGRG